MRFASTVLAGLLTGAALAVPAPNVDSLLEHTTYLDAPFDIPIANLSTSLVIPRGLNNTAGIVLLVHATGSTGNESWGVSPYNLLLPAKGYAIAWVNLPGDALGDSQISAEYVAYNIQQLARHSATGQIVVIGHSQGGGILVQWALLYWPATRALVSRFVALSGDLHGSDEIPLLCTARDLLRGGCQATFIQQTTGSNLLNAQDVRGNQALVPTTSIYTRDDEAIQPEIGYATSIVPGADNYALQDLNVCGPLHVADHFDMVVDPAAYGLALLALGAGPGPTPIGDFNAAYCSYFVDDELLNLSALPKILLAIFNAVIRVETGRSVVSSEPPLKQYVCDEGDATQNLCNSTSGGRSFRMSLSVIIVCNYTKAYKRCPYPPR